MQSVAPPNDAASPNVRRAFPRTRESSASGSGGDGPKADLRARRRIASIGQGEGRRDRRARRARRANAWTTPPPPPLPCPAPPQRHAPSAPCSGLPVHGTSARQGASPRAAGRTPRRGRRRAGRSRKRANGRSAERRGERGRGAREGADRSARERAHARGRAPDRGPWGAPSRPFLLQVRRSASRANHAGRGYPHARDGGRSADRDRGRARLVRAAARRPAGPCATTSSARWRVRGHLASAGVCSVEAPGDAAIGRWPVARSASAESVLNIATFAVAVLAIGPRVTSPGRLVKRRAGPTVPCGVSYVPVHKTTSA